MCQGMKPEASLDQGFEQASLPCSLAAAFRHGTASVCNQPEAIFLTLTC